MEAREVAEQNKGKDQKNDAKKGASASKGIDRRSGYKQWMGLNLVGDEMTSAKEFFGEPEVEIVTILDKILKKDEYVIVPWEIFDKAMREMKGGVRADCLEEAVDRLYNLEEDYGIRLSFKKVGRHYRCKVKPLRKYLRFEVEDNKIKKATVKIHPTKSRSPLGRIDIFDRTSYGRRSRSVLYELFSNLNGIAYPTLVKYNFGGFKGTNRLLIHLPYGLNPSNLGEIYSKRITAMRDKCYMQHTRRGPSRSKGKTAHEIYRAMTQLEREYQKNIKNSDYKGHLLDILWLSPGELAKRLSEMVSKSPRYIQGPFFSDRIDAYKVLILGKRARRLIPQLPKDKPPKEILKELIVKLGLPKAKVLKIWPDLPQSLEKVWSEASRTK